MSISPKQVMDLRAATGLPMMKCKQALEAENGDFEKALDRLRKEGLKAAESKVGRATGDGVVKVKVDGVRTTMVLVRCETEPVRNTPNFTGFAEKVLASADAAGSADVASLLKAKWAGKDVANVGDALNLLVAQIGENIQVGGVVAWKAGPGELLSHYVHHDERWGAVVRVAAASITPAVEAVARELCQHVVFSKPLAMDRSSIPAAEIEKEKEIYRAQVAQDPKMAGKPAQVIENIVKGKLEAFYRERILPDQLWYKDNAQSVTAVLKAQGASVKGFALLQAGA